MDDMKSLLVIVTEEKSLASELTMTAFRAFTGFTLALAHGLGKVPPSERFVDRVAELGFPVPTVFAWAATGAELLGGILLGIGLLARPAAASIAFTMSVAAFGVHAADPFQRKELAFFYLAASLVFVARGSGRFSVDRLIR
jgi:putative oxidoreductase